LNRVAAIKNGDEFIFEQVFNEYHAKLYFLKEFLKQVTDVINRMPEMQRKTFQMSRVDGLSYNEIAEKLSISIKTVEVHIGRALKKIRKQLPILVLLPWIYFLSGKG